MKNTINCPKCGEEIVVEEILKHQIEEQVRISSDAKHQKELEEVKLREHEEVAKNFAKELDEEKEINKKRSIQLEELLEETRKLRRKDEEREIEMKKKLLEEEEKIRVEVKKKTDEEHEIRDLEKDKKLGDALKQIEDLKTRIQQGSQQTQGESLELALESALKIEFPADIITEVKKGQRGADVSEVVVDKLGRSCGTILWESKNAVWKDDWVSKLKEDQRQAKADLSVLVTVNLPSGIETFGFRDGVWVCGWKYFVPLALALRFNLVSINHEKQTKVGLDEKMKELYQYLTGNEFKHRVEGIVDSFTILQEELEKEKRYFNTKWARQEREIRRVVDYTHGMYGDLKSVIGKSLPDIESLSLDSGKEPGE